METVESIESGKVSDGREVAMESVLVDRPIDKGSDDDVVGMYVKNAARSRSERTHWGPPNRYNCRGRWTQQKTWVRW